MNVSVEVILVDLCCERFDVEIAIQSNDDYCRRLVMLCNCSSPDTIRYDTIGLREAILTCARKTTWVSLIYRTATTTKKGKTEKLKSKKRIRLEVTVKVWRIHVVSPEEEKEMLRCTKGCAEKGGFKAGMKEWVGDGKLRYNKYDC